MATVTIRPNSDSYKDYLTLSSGSDAYALIDEATLDTGDYVACDIGGGQLQVGWTDTGLSNETINKVTFYINAAPSTGTKQIGHRTDKGFVTWDDFSSISGNNYSKEFTANPRTASAWTVSELDNLVCGFLALDTDDKNTQYIYQFYAVVDYTAAGGGDPSSIINHIMHYRRLMSR